MTPSRREAADPVGRGVRAQPDGGAEVAEGDAPVARELAEDLAVGGVHAAIVAAIAGSRWRKRGDWPYHRRHARTARRRPGCRLGRRDPARRDRRDGRRPRHARRLPPGRRRRRGVATADFLYAAVAAAAGARPPAARAHERAVRSSRRRPRRGRGARAAALRRRADVPDRPPAATHHTYARFVALTSINPTTVAYFAALIAGLRPSPRRRSRRRSCSCWPRASRRSAGSCAGGLGRAHHRLPVRAAVDRARRQRAGARARGRGWRSPRRLAAMAFRTLRIDELDPIAVTGLRWHPFAMPSACAPSASTRTRRRRRGRIEEHTEDGSDHEDSTSCSPAAPASELDGERIDAPAGTLVFLPSRRPAGTRSPRRTARPCSPSAAPDHEVSSWEWRFRAQPHIDPEEWEKGIALMHDGLAANPGEASLLYNLACFETRLGRLDDAAAHLREAVDAGERSASGPPTTTTSTRFAIARTGRCDRRGHLRRPRQRVGARRRPGRCAGAGGDDVPRPGRHARRPARRHRHRRPPDRARRAHRARQPRPAHARGRRRADRRRAP